MKPLERVLRDPVFLVAIAFLVVFSCAKVTEAKDFGFNRGERELLNLAYQEGSKTAFPEVLQAIMLNESVAGRWGRHGDKQFDDWRKQCYGVMQVQFYTGRLVVDRWTDYELDDRRLRLRLQYDDAFNVEIARIYFEYLLEFNNGNVSRAILSYNVGPGNVAKHGLDHDPNDYLLRATKNMQLMHKYNAEFGNGAYVKYTIKKGDTLFSIASRILYNGWRWREILAVNPDIEPTRLQIGDEIIIKK